MVSPNDIQKYLNSGWSLGMCSACSHKGMICVSKDNNITYIHKDELDKYIKDGWVRGNCHINNKGSNNPSYGKICVNRNGVIKRILPQDLDKYMQNGWYKGMGKRNIKNKDRRI